VLHFVRYRRDELDGLLGQINATGYGLTLGLHTRIDETIARVAGAAHAGNVYVNRNMVGAVVGVQPFGGEGLSGTGPKAGGPLYLYRLLAERPDDVLARALASDEQEAPPPRPRDPALRSLIDWASGRFGGLPEAGERFASLAASDEGVVLPGPTGERNVYRIAPRSGVLCLASADGDRLVQLAAALATGCRAIWPADAEPLLRRLPPAVQARVAVASDWTAGAAAFDVVLLSGSVEELGRVQRQLTEREGPVIAVERMEPGETAVPMERLVVERSLSINTAAAGGNASLMTLG
jgi:RHH-type proline utilization regulon transcriptional repressor/proline dehydrogenase/delta 1-pyrroline-5-carboxylate dehydrogenase